jgi:hypothetical protein
MKMTPFLGENCTQTTQARLRFDGLKSEKLRTIIQHGNDHTLILNLKDSNSAEMSETTLIMG